MRLLLRFGIFFIIAGLLVGWLLRFVMPGRNLLLYLLSVAPWLLHCLFLSNFALQADVPGLQIGIFLAASSLLAVAVVSAGWFGLRAAWRALIPLGLATLYSLGPLLWFSRVLVGSASRLDSIPTVTYWGLSLLAASLLFSYSWQRS